MICICFLIPFLVFLLNCNNDLHMFYFDFLIDFYIDSNYDYFCRKCSSYYNTPHECISEMSKSLRVLIYSEFFQELYSKITVFRNDKIIDQIISIPGEINFYIMNLTGSIKLKLELKKT